MTDSRNTRSTPTLFQPQEPQIDAAKLLDFVTEAAWEKVEELMPANCMLMFEEAKAVDINGETIVMSPLKYAFYVHDYYMQNIFEKAAIECGQLEKFLQQASEQQTGFDLSPLKKIYKAMLTVNGDRIAASNASADNAGELQDILGTFWPKKIGEAQLQLLPRHMLRQMCAEAKKGRYLWSPQASFDDSRQPRDNALCSRWTKDRKFIYLGEDYALARGGSSKPWQFTGAGTGQSEQMASNDLATFEHLLKTRLTQQTNRLAHLSRRVADDRMKHFI